MEVTKAESVPVVLDLYDIVAKSKSGGIFPVFGILASPAKVRKACDNALAASVSLGTIASEGAVDGLVAIAPAAAVIADKKQKELHSHAVDTLGALAKNGTQEARSLLVKYADDARASARAAARKALGLSQ